MSFVDAKDGTQIFVRDWGKGKPVVLIHGWPLNADTWEHQARALLDAGYRVIGYDRRGFGRSEQPVVGYDYDTFADDLASVVDALSLSDFALVGFSMGGGEIARYMSRHGGKGVSKVAFISSVVPGILKTADNPDGVPEEELEKIKDGIVKDRQAFFVEFTKSFYGVGMLSHPVSQAVLDWSWGMAMIASPIATTKCVDAFGKTDFTGDIASINVPTLIIHGTGDATVPIKATSARLARLKPDATYIEYDGAPHGTLAANADQVNADILSFLAN